MAKRARQKRRASSRNNGPTPPPYNPLAAHKWTILGVLVTVVMLAALAYAVTHYGGEDGDDNGNGPEVLPDLGPAPRFSLVSIDGEPVDLAKYRGSVVVLDLFATWCGPCVDQMEELNRLRTRFPEGELVILSIDVDEAETEEMIRTFRDQNAALWPFCSDTDNVGSKYDATRIPTLAIIDKDGHLRWRDSGTTSYEKMVRMIEPLISGGP